MRLKPEAEVWYCPNHDSLVLIKPEYSMVMLKTGFRVSYKNYSFWRSKKHLSKYIYIGPFEPSFEIPPGEDLKLTGTELVKIATDLQKVKLSSDPTPLLPKYDGKVEYSASDFADIKQESAKTYTPKELYDVKDYFKNERLLDDPIMRDLFFFLLMMVLGIASLVALALVSNG